MTDESERGGECDRVRSAIASGREGIDWLQIEQHLTSCDACARGLARLTTAIQEQFAASNSLEAAAGDQQLDPVPAGVTTPATQTRDGPGRLIRLPNRAAAGARRRRFGGRLLVGL